MFLYNQICETLFSVHVDRGEQFRRDTCKVVDEINLDRLIFQKASMKIFDEQLHGCMPDEVTEDENGFCSCWLGRIQIKFVFDRVTFDGMWIWQWYDGSKSTSPADMVNGCKWNESKNSYCDWCWKKSTWFGWWHMFFWVPNWISSINCILSGVKHCINRIHQNGSQWSIWVWTLLSANFQTGGVVWH